MSQQYDEYLEQHKANVIKGYQWMKENMPEIIDEVELYFDLEDQIVYNHDASKSSIEEYDAYDNYFFSGNRTKDVIDDFNVAWLHHIHNNPHHWESWVLIDGEPDKGEMIMDMPLRYVVEMICDWWAFSWKEGNLLEIFNWYKSNKPKMKMSENTEITVEAILGLMEDKLM